MCEKCRTTCSVCGEPVTRTNRRTGPRRCKRCQYTTRKNLRTCQKCSAQFEATNNMTRLCPACEQSGYCLDCGVKISSKYAVRCNSCNQRYLHEIGVFQSRGAWARYEYNGIKYRSKWEVEFATTLTDLGIEFEYERWHSETRTRPDFYFVPLDLYVEIHPDCWGEKILPRNAILLKTIPEVRAFCIMLEWLTNREKAKEEYKAMRTPRLRYQHKMALKFACDLRQMIYRRDGK
jgi:hypothetical protein